MAQSQRQAYVHKDKLCSTNKQYALMDSNKKVDLDNPLCPNESTIMANILQNHPLRFSIAASSSVPWINLGFIKLIMGHYMTAYLEISRRLRDKYHNLEHDEMVKSIFNSGKNKARVGMKIPSWMITDEMQLKENYRIFRIPSRRSTRFTPPTPIPTAAEVKDMNLQDTIQLSIAKQKSREVFEAQ
ncbi:hypothetical protein Tco_0200228 [Tanacetum coccineum]